MPSDKITLRIDGLPEYGGQVSATVFLHKLRVFVATLYALERAFSGRRRRRMRLDVADLSKTSPGRVTLQAIETVRHYDASIALGWSYEQFETIVHGRHVDDRVDEFIVASIIDLSLPRTSADDCVLAVEYGTKMIALGRDAAEHALAIRNRLPVKPAPWVAGISKGSLFGELRGVLDVSGERVFYICPPSGPDQVECIFPESMRAAMAENLFQVVRVHGHLHYDGSGAFPRLKEAERVEGAEAPTESFSALYGIFAGERSGDAFEVN